MDEFNKKQESVERRKKEREIDMRNTMSEKIEKHKRKEIFAEMQRTQYEVFKEEHDKKLNERINKITDKVFINKNLFIYFYS